MRKQIIALAVGFVLAFTGVSFAANGDILFSQRSSLRILFLDAQSTSDSGVWLEVRGSFNKSFSVDALETGATAEIMCVNGKTKPANATDGPIMITLTPTVLAGTVNASFRYCKAKKAQGGTPAPSTLTMEGR